MFRKGYKLFKKDFGETYEEVESTGLRGRFYIGTYEKRPGAYNDYTAPDPDYREGNYVGDDPTGTLTSDGFLILGDSIQFLIGGGCDHLVVFVELLIDGFPSMRATGRCSERMKEIQWNVGEFFGRSAQIRIVDIGRGKWNHISVDNFKFSWNVNAGAPGAALFDNSPYPHKQHYSGHDQTSQVR